MKRDMCRAMLIVLAMMCIRVGSLETSWFGFLDRTIQGAVAAGCVYVAIRSKPTDRSAK